MGYNLYITRKDNWFEEGKDIASDEWLAIVSKDPELSIYEGNGPNFAIWKTLQPDEEYWLDWNEGNIYSKSPDQILVIKMVEIAKLLNAVVQGEECEIYDENYRVNNNQINLDTEKIKHELNENKETKSSWIKRILGKR
jgi:hypothetical protein